MKLFKSLIEKCPIHVIGFDATVYELAYQVLASQECFEREEKNVSPIFVHRRVDEVEMFHMMYSEE